MPYTCVGFVVMLVSRRRRRGGALSLLPPRRGRARGALAGGGRAPSATEARRRVDPGNARRRPAGWRRRRARARGGAALLALSPQRGSPVLRSPRAATKGAKTTCLKFVAHFAFGRGFSLSLLEGIQNGRARLHDWTLLHAE